MPNRRLPREVVRLHGGKTRRTPFSADLQYTPRPPTWLSPAGKREWKRVVGLCKHWEGWIQQVDRACLTAYCTAWAAFEDAAKEVAKNGVMIEGRSAPDRERLVKNPAVAVMRDASTTLRYWSRELGFTPDSRGRIDLTRMPSSSSLQDKLDDLLD